MAERPLPAYDGDEDRIRRFVLAYQEEAPLTMGELWALSPMLRLVLLDNFHWTCIGGTPGTVVG